MSKKKEVTIEDKLKGAIIPKEEHPYEIPDNWEWVRLGTIVQNFDNMRKPLSQVVRNKITKDRNYEYYGATGVIDYVDDYIYEGRYILVGEDGANLISKSKKNAFIAEGKFWVNNHAHVLQVISKFIKESYFVYQYNCLDLTEYITGSAQPKLNAKNLSSIKIPLPPLEEQERIVKKLDSMLERINEAKELIAQAKETFENRRASILNLAFSGELTRKWRESNSIESSKILLENLNKEKIRLWEEECEKALEEGKKKPSKPKLLSMDEMLIPKEEQPYKIPESWECVKLEGIIEHTTNLDIQKKLDKNETINYVDIESINNKLFKINTIKEKKVSELSTRARRVLKKGYMMYSLVRPYLNNFALIEEEKENFIGSTGFAVFKSKVSPIKYIFYYMQTNYIKEYYQSFLKGFNSPSITVENFNSTSIPLPPLEEQKEIVRILDSVLEKEEKINEILELEEMIELLEKSILDKAFRGELGTGNLGDVPSLEVLKNILEK
ncbi:MAG: restriction endonuclease subunit S [Cetobacterium sp.]